MLSDPVIDALQGNSSSGDILNSDTPQASSMAVQQSGQLHQDPVVSAFGSGNQTIEQMREQNSGAPSGMYQNFESVTHLPLSNTPIDVRNAKDVTGAHDLDGLCETAVEQWAGLPNLGSTAFDAFQNMSSQGKVTRGLGGVQPGDVIWWSPNDSNQGAGHASLYLGNGQMISATGNGVRQDDMQNWAQSTSQYPLGYMRPQ